MRYETSILLIDLMQRGIQLKAKGDRVRYRPKDAMTDELLDRIGRHRKELLYALRGADARTWYSAADLQKLARIDCAPGDLPLVDLVKLTFDADGMTTKISNARTDESKQ